MIDRQFGKVVYECDNCGDGLDTEEREFEDALSVFRAAGWLAEKVGREWVHTCGKCR